MKDFQFMTNNTQNVQIDNYSVPMRDSRSSTPLYPQTSFGHEENSEHFRFSFILFYFEISSPF